jgi:hypothetical protein
VCDICGGDTDKDMRDPFCGDCGRIACDECCGRCEEMENERRLIPDRSRSIPESFKSGADNRDNMESVTNITDTLRKEIEKMLPEVKVEQEESDKPLEISSEFAGIIFVLTQLAKSNIISEIAFTSTLRQFYQYETGNMLRSGQLEALLLHEKVMNYDAKIKDNVAAVYEKKQRLDLERQTLEIFGKTEEKKEHWLSEIIN